MRGMSFMAGLLIMRGMLIIRRRCGMMVWRSDRAGVMGVAVMLVFVHATNVLPGLAEREPGPGRFDQATRFVVMETRGCALSVPSRRRAMMLSIEYAPAPVTVNSSAEPSSESGNS